MTNQSCSITIHRTATGYLFRVVGRGTLRESPAVREFVCGAIEDGAEIVMDLSACDYLDSTFLGCLVIMHKAAERATGTFSVFADDAVKTRLFSSFRIERFLVFVDQCPTSIGSPVSLQLTNLDRAQFGKHLLDAHRQLADLGGPAAETFRSVVQRLTNELNRSRY